MELNILHNDKIIYSYDLNLTKFVEESAKKGNIVVELNSGQQIPAECCVKNLEFQIELVHILNDAPSPLVKRNQHISG